MACCQCQGIEQEFGEKQAARDLKSFRRKGASKTTRLLIEALTARNVAGMRLLDVGGGVGAIQVALLKNGIAGGDNVDASTAYLSAAKSEAKRLGLSDRMNYHHGDIVDLATHLQPADVVTLDRVICCYHDYKKLVDVSSRLSTRFYAAIFPVDRWHTRLIFWFGNIFMRVKRSPMRVFIHPTDGVADLLTSNGFTQIWHERRIMWQILLYEREKKSE